jgi:putative transposase
MTGYRRNFIAGGSFFFTVNLAQRRLRLLTDHIAELRAAFDETRRRHPFTVDAMVVLPITSTHCGRCRKAMPISRRAGG